MPTVSENHEARISQHFIDSDLITSEQMAVAVQRQKQTGERIETILIDMNFITVDELITILKEYYNSPGTDLFVITIKPQDLNSLSYEKMCQFNAIPIHNAQKYFVAMVDPNDYSSVREIEFILGKEIQPVVVPHFQLQAVLKFLKRRGGRLTTPLLGSVVQSESSNSGSLDAFSGIDKLLVELENHKASDLLISAGIPPCLKVNHEIVRLPLHPLSPKDVEILAKELMTEDQWDEYEKNGGVDFGFLKPDIGRFRVNIYRQRSSVSISIRGIAERIPDLKSLGFADALDEFIFQPQGLILITGPTGHGKSTTVAAIIDALNSKRKSNIVTIEDPIEVLHKHKLCNVNQREVGRDTPSFKEGLRLIFRQAPDIIVIGEMRDMESFECALHAAGTGHLVISTMHANSTTQAIERIIDMFPMEKQDQIRNQMAEVLTVCIGQRLIPQVNEKGRVLAFEKLASSTRIKNLIRENKCHQIRTLFQQAVDEYVPIDFSLANLVKRDKIAIEDGLKYCSSPASFKSMLSSGPSRSTGHPPKTDRKHDINVY